MTSSTYFGQPHKRRTFTALAILFQLVSGVAGASKWPRKIYTLMLASAIVDETLVIICNINDHQHFFQKRHYNIWQHCKVNMYFNFVYIQSPVVLRFLPTNASPGAPDGPISPVGPCIPWRPVGPRAPTLPGLPGSPVSPCKPRSPSSPFGPCGPTGPAGPTSPWGPSGPGITETYHILYKVIASFQMLKLKLSS